MKSWRRPWQATGDKSNGGHPHGASRSNRVIPSPATPLTGQRTPLHRHRSATPYGLRSAVASPLSTGPQQARKKLHGRSAPLVVSIDMAHRPMSEQALRLGLAQLARSLRRVNPGVQFTFVRPDERLNRSAAPARTRKVRRPGARPKDERTVTHRRGMATATSLRRS